MHPVEHTPSNTNSDLLLSSRDSCARGITFVCMWGDVFFYFYFFVTEWNNLHRHLINLRGKQSFIKTEWNFFFKVVVSDPKESSAVR